MPCRLIVTADDFGLSPAINDEILRCIDEGILTSVSLMAGGFASEQAFKAAASFPETVGVGVHLTLDTTKSVAPAAEVATILGDDGYFLPLPTMVRKLLLAQATQEDVYREWSAQIEKTLAAGVRPDHLDGHRHIHILPSLLGVVIRLAHKYDLKAVRLPLDPLPSGEPFKRLAARVSLNMVALWARNRFGSLRHPDCMLGFSVSGCYDENTFLKDITRIKSGQTVEAMFHPGPTKIDIKELSYLKSKWSVDSATLRSAQVKEQIEELEIELITFGQCQR